MSTDLKLGLNLGYWQRTADDATELVQAAERLGYESVWTAEAYGSDAFTPWPGTARGRPASNWAHPWRRSPPGPRRRPR